MIAQPAIMLADPGTVERSSRRTHGDKMQDDPVALRPCGSHVAENAESGEGGFHRMRPPGCECALTPPQCLAPRANRAAGRRAMQDLIRIDDIKAAETAHAGHSGLAAAVWTRNHMESRHCRLWRPGGISRDPGRAGQGSDPRGWSARYGPRLTGSRTGFRQTQAGWRGAP